MNEVDEEVAEVEDIKSPVPSSCRSEHDLHFKFESYMKRRHPRRFHFGAKSDQGAAPPGEVTNNPIPEAGTKTELLEEPVTTPVDTFCDRPGLSRYQYVPSNVREADEDVSISEEHSAQPSQPARFVRIVMRLM
ncbi:hypothetical protein Anas_09232 [Armadillidium nasatum]|uniref:Uncharacterized protein n=1 Tax=Armadillidium nasatum TaxID=96803 RepID=A0A5N5SZY7_9CRUS|nr:hypothetical protein Anas_09232 [Armadillidium nasatum]